MDTSTPDSASGAHSRTGSACEFDGFLLAPAARALSRAGLPIELNPRAFDLLLTLVLAAGKVLPRDTLLRSAWDCADFTDANLRVQISNLRKALARHGGGGRHIDSVPGKGYCFVAPVRWLQAPLSTAPPGAIDHVVPLGRDDAIAHVAALLRENALVTLAGIGGVGKSTVARTLAKRFADAGLRVVTLDLAQPGADLALPLATVPSLLILENCECDTDLAAVLAQAMARHHPGLPLLAVSRESLQLSSETVVRLPPLALPPRGAGLTLTEACRYPAVQLFCDRAMIHCAGFHVDDGDVPNLIELCHALDGLPLALELAARHTAWRGYTGLPPWKDEAVPDRGAELPQSDPESRRRSIWHSLDWSFERLSAREQTALCRLSVFRGGFGMISVSCALTGCGMPESMVLPTLQALVGKSLVTVDHGPDVTLYRLLNSTKAYALERYVARRQQCQALYPTKLGDLPPLLLHELLL